MARVTLLECEKLCREALRKAGLHDQAATIVASNITSAERDGCSSHGMFRLAGYCASLRSGKVDGSALPEARSMAPGCVAVDAKRGFSTPACLLGHTLLVEKAKTNGVAVLTIANAFHFASLWQDVEPLASKHGLVAMAFLNSKAFVAHDPGGVKPLYGTNPMAFACPRKAEDGSLSAEPFVFDQASAAMARGDIQLAKRDGKELPPGVAIDAQGHPTQDPTAALGGAQLPFASHKGTAIALMVEILAASLSGGAFSFEALATDNGDGGPTQHGELILAIDPERCGAGNQQRFLSRVEVLLKEVEAEAHVAEAADRTLRLPSQRRFAKRKRTPDDGFEVPQALYDQCLRLAGDSENAAE